MTKEEYKENLIRMWDSLRIMSNAYEAIEIVENWAKEHPVKTNADKYKEVFGFEPPLNRCIQNNVSCAYCGYYDARVSICRADERFWNTEYKEPAESEVE